MHSNSGKAFLFAAVLLLSLALCVSALADPVFAVDKKELLHGEPVKITYDLSAYTFDHAELWPFARWNAGSTNGATYSFPVIPLQTVPKGTYTFTDTNIGDSIYWGIFLSDVDGSYLNYLSFAGDDGEVYLTDSWNTPSSVPSFQSVTPSATLVSAGTPISANYVISGGNAAYDDIDTYWSVYDDEGFQVFSNWESQGSSSIGTATLDAPSKGGTHYLSAAVRCADGWEYAIEDTTHGIVVQGDTTSDPLTLQLTFKDVNGNILDWTQDAAIPGQPIYMSWELRGGYTAYQGYLNLRPISGDTNFGSMGRAAATGTLDFWVNENASPVILEVECDDNHGNTISQQITIPVVPTLQMTAAFQQNSAKPGDTVTVNWNITGGLAPYDVQVDWTFDEGCMRKTDQSTTSSLPQGSDSYTVPLSAAQLEAHLTVRDQSGVTRDEYLYLPLNRDFWGHMPNFQISYDKDWVQSGDPITASWNIDMADHTVNTVRTAWVTLTKHFTYDGFWWEYAQEPWVDAQAALSGSVTYPAASGGIVYLLLEITDQQGFSCQGMMERIQVVQPGSIPLTASLQITPNQPTVDDPPTITWDVQGATPSTTVNLTWNIYEYDYGNTNGNKQSLPFQGSETVSMAHEGNLHARLEVRDDELNVNFSRELSVEVIEPSGITLSVTPQNPVIGDQVTVEWTIDRTDVGDAYLNIEVYSGNLSKWLIGDHITGNDILSGKKTFTLTEGDAFSVRMEAYTSNRFVFESLDRIPIGGTWNSPPRVSVSVTYASTSATTGDTLHATYAISGSGNYTYINPCWVYKAPNGEAYFIRERVTDQSTGTLDVVANRPGNYYLHFTINDGDWSFNPDWLEEINDPSVPFVSVTGPEITLPLSIDFYDGYPSEVDLIEGFELTWDVVGGDAPYNLRTTLHIETDDGWVYHGETGDGSISTFDPVAYGVTNWWWVYAQDPIEVAASRSIKITLTPTSNGISGTPKSITIPVVHHTSGGCLTLPADTVRIEDEAFLAVAADEFVLPASLTFIGTNAFPPSATLIVPANSYAESWAQANGYAYQIN